MGVDAFVNLMSYIFFTLAGRRVITIIRSDNEIASAISLISMTIESLII